MKRIDISRVVVFSMPLFLAACADFPPFMNESRDSGGYYNQAPAKASSTVQTQSKQAAAKAAPATKMVEPGESTVVMPKAGSSAKTAAQVDGPMVPGNAPAVGQ
jgi:hypothetical protein